MLPTVLSLLVIYSQVSLKLRLVHMVFGVGGRTEELLTCF